MAGLDSWERQYYSSTDAEALLFYVVYGSITTNTTMSATKYRSSGVPTGFSLSSYDKNVYPTVHEDFLTGYVWDQYRHSAPLLCDRIIQSPACMILRGSIIDPPTLDYLRDAIGVLTFLVDSGGIAIYDPQQFCWWSPEEWRKLIFSPEAPRPRNHVAFLESEEDSNEDCIWLHTRGMRKFARPDISIRGVAQRYRSAAVDLCERFVELQAFGGVVPEDQEIRINALPPGGRVHHAGDLEDIEFNNTHIELVWPGSGLA